MNDTIFLFLNNLSNQSAFMDSLIVFFSFYLPYIVIAAAGIFIFMHHEVFKSGNPILAIFEKKKEISRAFLTGVLAWLVAKFLKLLFAIARPVNALDNINPLLVKTDYSFPSGHATFFMALAFSIYFFHKRAGYVFMLLAVLIGLARIMAGVHFPVDILGGFILGALIAYLVKKV